MRWSSRTVRAGARLTGAVLAAGLLTACSEAGVGPDSVTVDSLSTLPRPLSAVEQQAVTAGNRFALSLLREADARANGKNVLLSPLSVSLALGMSMNGATGTTLQEMQQTLGWGPRTQQEINTSYRDLMALLPALDTTVTVQLSNGIWVRQPLVADTGFASDVQRYFNASIASSASPQAMFDAVNTWAREKTDGLIPKVLDEPPPDNLVMMIANATLFNGAWRDKFDAADTRNEPFRLESGASVSIPLMRRSGNFRGVQTAAYDAVELAYGNSAYQMLVIVPKTGTVSDLVTSLDSARLTAINSALQPAGEKAQVVLPRFTVRGALELSPHLKALGMPRAFSDAAEFPRLVGPRVQIAFVRHGMVLEVDERGTRAAAVTGIGFGVTSAPPQYRVDRPFVFLIRERFAGTVLFAGVVRDPRQ